ncbi:hypothetical protein BH20ACT5_BH20ACT5_01330 [soil metagenome]
MLENTIGLLTPFVAYLAAEEIHASGVVSAVVAGLYLGHHMPRHSSYAGRLQAGALWNMLDFLLESMVFALIGLQLRGVLLTLDDRDGGTVALGTVVITLVVILTRFLWVFPATYLPRRLSKRLAERDPSPPWQIPVVLSWAGMRGVVSLAAAFALPLTAADGEPFPARDLIQFVAFVVVIVTLVLQGFSLPWLIRRLGVTGRESHEDNVTEAGAQQDAADAALARLDDLLADDDGRTPQDVVERLRQRAESRSLQAWGRLGATGPDRRETPQEAYRRLRREMLEAERRVFVELRDSGRIDDEVLRRVLQELDLEEAILARE